MKRALRWTVVALCAALAAALAAAMLDLSGAGPLAADLPAQVAAQLGASGVTHPVTAVLLNFRAYDTLLEVVVLLLALLALPHIEGDRARAGLASPEPVLAGLARTLAPLVVLVAAYLLWAGAHRAGGAFQAGAVLAAGAVLLRVADLMPRWSRAQAGLRAAQGAGLALFLAVAAGGGATLLRYPPEWAEALILVIEAGLTVSIGLILAAFFLGAPRPPRSDGEGP